MPLHSTGPSKRSCWQDDGQSCRSYPTRAIAIISRCENIIARARFDALPLCVRFSPLTFSTSPHYDRTYAPLRRSFFARTHRRFRPATCPYDVLILLSASASIAAIVSSARARTALSLEARSWRSHCGARCTTASMIAEMSASMAGVYAAQFELCNGTALIRSGGRLRLGRRRMRKSVRWYPGRAFRSSSALLSNRSPWGRQVRKARQHHHRGRARSFVQEPPCLALRLSRPAAALRQMFEFSARLFPVFAASVRHRLAKRGTGIPPPRQPPLPGHFHLPKTAALNAVADCHDLTPVKWIGCSPHRELVAASIVPVDLRASGSPASLSP